MTNKRTNANNTNINVTVGTKFHGNPVMELHKKITDYKQTEKHSRTPSNILELGSIEDEIEELIKNHPNQLQGKKTKELIKSYK